MKYPIPKKSDFFLFDEKGRAEQKKLQRMGQFQKSLDFSWVQENPHMEGYRKFVQKYMWLYKSIPFVHSLYICNSMSFNALNSESDIDLFIITKPGALWRARFFTWLYFGIFGIKRFGNRQKKKFCLSFYVTQDQQNLYNIMLPQNDIYFIYRLAHLIPIYQETYENIYKHNRRLHSVLPYFPGKSTINIGLTTMYGRSRWKKWSEFRCGGLRGTFIEFLIKCIRLPIVIYKKKRLGPKGRGVITNRNILKFHGDIRKKVHLLYEVYIKQYNQKNIMG